MYGQKVTEWKDICPFTFMCCILTATVLSACTLDWPRKVVIGNAKTESVSAIWNGSELRDLQIAQVMGKRKALTSALPAQPPWFVWRRTLISIKI